MIDLTENIKGSKIIDGFGVLLFDDESIYIGKFSQLFGNSTPHYYGKLLLSNRNSYSGEISNGRIEGYGLYKTSDSHGQYEGEWMNETQDGLGIEKWNSTLEYQGIFDFGQKTVGKMTWEDGSFYEGEFHNNNFNGYVRILTLNFFKLILLIGNISFS